MDGHSFLSGSQANFTALVKRAGLLGSRRNVGKQKAADCAAPPQQDGPPVYNFKKEKYVKQLQFCRMPRYLAVLCSRFAAIRDRNWCRAGLAMQRAPEVPERHVFPVMSLT